MRIVILLIKYVLMITIGLSLIGLITREGLLFWGTQQVRIAENKMEVVAGAKNKSEYDDQCFEKSSGRSGSGVRSIQLRFTSDTEYQVDVTCDFFSNDPIVVQTYKLPPFVEKVSGQSGFLYDPVGMSGVVLEVYHRRTTLLLDGKKFKMIQGISSIAGNQPQATCGGFGYACCNAETQKGTGDLFKQATDCPKECYPICVARPSVLKFTSDPNPDLKNRVVILPKGTPITFYFVSDPGISGQATTQIKLGDGQTKDFLEQDGNYTHQYQCAQAECLYQAQLVVTDLTGDTSVLTQIAKIDIVIR
ncbi:MAG: hypothetical protein ABI425_04800 [Patescibacteria group bacterium]